MKSKPRSPEAVERAVIPGATIVVRCGDEVVFEGRSAFAR